MRASPKLQLDKLAAEETHTAAVEKARLAEQERARLAAEGAKKEAQAKADADAKAAETARIAAEKAQQMAQMQAAEGERQRAEKITSNPIVAANSAADTPAPSIPRSAPDKGTNVAALSDGPSQADISKSVQSELRRVGCLKADADGDWNATSQRSLTLFNRYAKTRLDTKVASNDALDTIKQQSSRVCPLVCEHGFKTDGDRCTRIVCAEGSFLNDDNECEKRRARKPVASREEDDRPVRSERPVREWPQAQPGASAPRPRASAVGGGSGQIFCDGSGCRAVRPGCHIDHQGGSPRSGSGGNEEVCN